ncbi:hypothetical protein [Citrobacter amalonaticus]|uniref:hypothetical protein n=1 Tax=Citrobacter amalonaticus TaxID=35703 RepID=UPI00300D7243
MNDKISESEIVPYFSEGADSTGAFQYSQFYQRTPVEDEMFSVERLSSSVEVSYFNLGVGWSDSEILQNTTLGFDYTAYDSDFLIPAGQTLNFYVMTDASTSGDFSLSFYPATEKSTDISLPAGSGERKLLTTLIAETYESFTLSMLKSSEYPVTVELEDTTGNIIGQFQFESANNQYLAENCTWKGYNLDFTMEPGESFNFYAINSTISGNPVQVSFYLQTWEVQSDTVGFVLPADTSSHIIYTRTSPTREYMAVAYIEESTAVPVTLEINNGSQSIQHTFTFSGERWYPDNFLLTEFGQQSTFALVNNTIPLVDITGKFMFNFQEM